LGAAAPADSLTLTLLGGNYEQQTFNYFLSAYSKCTTDSNFEILLCLGAFVAAIWDKELRKINLFMQNKPNLAKKSNERNFF